MTEPAMYSFSFEVPESQLQRLVSGLCLAYGYTDEETDGTKIDYARRKVAENVVTTVQSVERAEREKAVAQEIVPLDLN